MAFPSGQDEIRLYLSKLVNLAKSSTFRSSLTDSMSPSSEPLTDMRRTRVFGVIVGCSDGRGYGQSIKLHHTKADLNVADQLIAGHPPPTINIHATITANTQGQRHAAA